MKRKRKEKDTILFLAVVVSLIIVVIFSLCYYYRHTIIRDPVRMHPNNKNYVFQIDDAILDGEKLSLSGWCFRIGDDTTEEAPTMRILLMDLEDENRYIFFTSEYWLPRADVNAYFQDEYDYTNCGFTAEISISVLNLQDHSYEVLIQRSISEKDAIPTGIYLTANGIQSTDPETYKPLEVEGTDLQEIVEKGVFQFYQPDAGLYIYQYGWKLYWIADENVHIYENHDELTVVAGTTQTDLLPSWRSESGLSSEILTYHFLEQEISDQLNCGNYRVACIDIPEKYVITYLKVGIFAQEKWVWYKIFHPRYELSEGQ